MEPNYKSITENFKKFIKEENQNNDEFSDDFHDFPNLNIEKVKDFIEKHRIKIISDYHDGGFGGEMKDGTNVFLAVWPDHIMITPVDKNDNRAAKLDMRHFFKS